jgi:hypothetical protein
VDCLQIGVGAGKSVERLDISQFEPAHSFSFRGKGRRPASSRQAALVLSIDELIGEYALPCPHYRQDRRAGVDGRHRRRRGADAPAELRELHIEASEQSTGGRQLVQRLQQAGFVIAARHVHGETTDLTFVRNT